MFFKKVSNFCKEHGTGILVVGGDFNEIMQDKRIISIRLACVLSFLRHVDSCLFSLYILQASINLLVFIKDFKLLKINNSVIQEYDYKQLINKVIDKYLIQYHNNKIDIR
jgi:hypothetical protein